MIIKKDFRNRAQPYFTVEDISDLTGNSLATTRVFLSRKVKNNELIRVKRNLYVLPDDWNQFSEKDLFQLANVIQTPSYISYTSALSYYNITTQVTSSVIESTNLMRSKEFAVESVMFVYHYCQKDFFFGYDKQDNVFIAMPEKALIDCLYLLSFGRYALDLEALDLKQIDWKLLQKWLKKYPKRFQKYCKQWRDDYENFRAT